MARTRTQGNPALDAAAAKVGAMLGTIAKKVDAVKRQRAEISAELDNVIRVAQQMKIDIGQASDEFRRAGGRAVGKARRQLSPEARERIANAARKRWAAYRKAKGKG